MKELLTQEERREVFYEVQHEFWMEDAKYYVEVFCDWHELGEDVIEKFDLDELATTYERHHDCDVAESDQWECVVRNYAEDNDLI